MKDKKSLLGFTILFIIILLMFFDGIVNFVVNIKWFKEVGYLSVYVTKIKAIIIMVVPIFIISFLSIWLYYRSLKNNIKKNNIINMEESKSKIGKKIFYILNLIISAIISYTFASAYWYRILQFTNSVDFNIKDPTFSKDISFYIFKLPLIESVYKVVMFLLAFLVIITFIFYFLVTLKDKVQYDKDFKENIREIKFTNNGIKKFAGKQLAILSFLIMIFIGVGYLIRSWNLVYSPNGVVFGASYTDIHVSLVFYRIIVVAAAISSVVIFLSVLKGKSKPIIVSVIAIVSLIVLKGISATIVQNFVVKSNEKTLEQPYIKNNIDLTRKAFDVNETQSVPFEVKNDLTKKDIQGNKESIDNIIINSFKPTLEFYNQVQIIRYYYNFHDADIDRYNIKDKYNQVFVAAREIDSEALNPNTWQNRHLIYTHGYGAVMNKVNSVTSEGQPDFVIKDIPPNNKTKIPFTDPRIYFGEKTNDYAVVNTKISEFDYPKGDSNKTNKYSGDAGINMTFGNKLLFAINKKEINFILSKDIKSYSKILINRNIVDRAKKIAPFLKYDSDPYMVINKGKIYWILDGYTNTDRYPYSEPYDNINYIRNSAKVVIDATNGKTDFYMMDNNDPIVKSYSKIFGGLFKNINEMPKELREHIKYPKDLFNIQSKVLGKYHVKDPGVFYNGEDLWEVSRNKKKVEGDKDESDAPYMITKLPGQSKEEMILLNYFNVMKKDNMIALFATRMDGKNYGKKVLYKLPADKTIYSPYLFKQKINQDTTISKELSLWNKEGSQVQYGDTVILPIKNSLLYIEPLYLRASGKNSIPEMKRIIMSYGDKLILANSIEEGIENIFNYKEKKDTDTAEKKDPKGIKSKNADVIKAKDLYNKALEAQKKGDWKEYGKNINELGNLLNNLK